MTRSWPSPASQISTALRKIKTIIKTLLEAIHWIIITAIKRRTNGVRWQMPIHSSRVISNNYYSKEWGSRAVVLLATATISIAPLIAVINAHWTIKVDLITRQSPRSLYMNKRERKFSHWKQQDNAPWKKSSSLKATSTMNSDRVIGVWRRPIGQAVTSESEAKIKDQLEEVRAIQAVEW